MNEMKPEVRFEGFENGWTKRSFSEILKINSGKDYKHLNPGTVPVYGTGGYMLSVDNVLSNIDSVGIGRKGAIDKPQRKRSSYGVLLLYSRRRYSAIRISTIPNGCARFSNKFSHSLPASIT